MKMKLNGAILFHDKVKLLFLFMHAQSNAELSLGIELSYLSCFKKGMMMIDLLIEEFLKFIDSRSKLLLMRSNNQPI